jgi:hypothetical protein
VYYAQPSRIRVFWESQSGWNAEVACGLAWRALEVVEAPGLVKVQRQVSAQGMEGYLIWTFLK